MAAKDVYVPERFKREIVLHIIKNMAGLPIRVPLIFGIHGPSGEGKTFQCEIVLTELGVTPFLLSGGQMESRDAGAPAQLIRATYRRAAGLDEGGSWQPAAVLLNDIDTGIGSWGEQVQYTVNRQTVIGELMHLCDYPEVIEGRSVRRVPIIVTGNDFSKLYEPLVRAGRMTSFMWKPSQEEKARMLMGLFERLSFEECKSLVKELEKFALKVDGVNSGLSMAYFSHLKSSLVDDAIWSSIDSMDHKEVISALASGRHLHVEFSETVEVLLDRGKEILQAGMLVNHLRRGE